MLRIAVIDTAIVMSTHDIAAKLRLVLTRPLEPGLNALASIGGVYCAVRHQLRRISLPCPAAVFVVRGCKIVWRGQERMEVRAGQMFLLPARMEITIENQPDEEAGRYVALCLSFTADMVTAVCAAHAGESRFSDLESLRVRVDQALALSVSHLLDMVLAEGRSNRLLGLCMEEILELISQRTACLPYIWESASSWSSRCSRLIALDPGQDWNAASIAAKLCVSERSLRRNLQIEGTNFRRILQDIRLNAGLGMLQAGRCSVGEAAFRCGYASASRFAGLFKERFGVSPGDVSRFNAGS